MTWIRDPRPGISWRAKRLRRRVRTKLQRLPVRLPAGLVGQDQLNARNRFVASWSTHWYDRPVDERVAVYEAFAGLGALGNPRAIFDELLDASDMTRLRHVWCFANLTVKREFDKQWASHPRVRSVLTGTTEYYKTLSTAKYLVNNQTFPPNFVKRSDQIYLNTWHGTPLKTMGYDSPEGPYGVRNTVRNFISADYLASPNEYTTRVLYESGYRLRGIYQGTVIEEGYPRVDRQFLSAAEQREVRAEFRGYGVDLGDEKIVLYAPTWRGRSFFDPVYDAEGLLGDVKLLADRLGPEYKVLLKVHQQIFRSISEHEQLQSVLVPNSFQTNRVLGCVHALVTDYSSIFFDFLASGKPVLFYTPDAQGYARDRGVLMDSEQLPGPTFSEIDGLAKAIGAISTGTEDDPELTHRDRYREAAETYCPWDDGKAAARVVDVVFRSRTEGYRLRHGLPDGRTSVLISSGRVRTSGVNTSLLSLLRNLDPEHYDVTLLVQPPRDDGERRLQALIPNSVRQLMRAGTYPVTAKHVEAHNCFLAEGLGADGRYPGDEARVLAAEWRHSLGISRFDHAIDFSGYVPFWPGMLLQGNVGTRSIWMHNDMIADSNREVEGKSFHKGLAAVFTLYRHFDNLVSVSESLARINAEQLGHLAPTSHFTSAHNTIDADRIHSLGSGAEVAGREGAADIPVSGVALSKAAEAFVRSYPDELVSDEVNRQISLARLMPDRESVTTFVTVGRLAPEKNHARMMRAFAQVHAESPETRLLVLGDGPLLGDLESLVDRLELTDAVRLAGYQSNPYALMAAADCFVMSSDYEGQPMVLLEALTLNLPVVTVEFGSAQSALPNKGGLIVPQSVDGLADGMRAFLRGEVTASGFDAADYNRRALEEFAGAIGETGGHGSDRAAGR